MNRPWLEADSLDEAVKKLSTEARKSDKHTVDEWYANQLEEIYEKDYTND